MRIQHRPIRTIAWALFTAAALTARAEDHHFFWEVKGAHNTVYLLGSVHMLKPADSALPAAVLRAYDRSTTLVMELNLNDIGAEQLLGAGLESALLPEGQTLAETLGSELYASYLAHAKPLGLDPEMTARFQPWFATLLLEQLTLARSGLEANSGIDMQLAKRAAGDHKTLVGLETMADQLGIFSHLSLEQQRQYLRTTLQQLDTQDTDVAQVVRAWQHGDTATMERLLREEAADSPQLFRMLTSDRNHRWLPKVTALLNDDHDDLVVVGAMHLVGKDGLIELLRAQGNDPVQH